MMLAILMAIKHRLSFSCCTLTSLFLPWSHKKHFTSFVGCIVITETLKGSGKHQIQHPALQEYIQQYGCFLCLL